MKMIKFAMAATAVCAVFAANAATQGTLGATSTGSYTNTFGSTQVRQVQVLNLQDAVVLNSTPAIQEQYNSSPGMKDQFCVVDTTGGAVNVKFTNTNSGSSFFANAKAADGSTIEYFWNSGLASGGLVRMGGDGSNTDLLVPAGQTVTAAANCGAGNVQKSASLYNPSTVPAGKTYDDVITVTATPQ